MGKQTSERTISGGMVRVDFFEDHVERIPKVREVLEEEKRTFRLLATVKSTLEHRPKIFSIKDDRIVAEVIIGRPILEMAGGVDGPQEALSVEEQMVSYVSEMHRFGVCMADVGMFGPDKLLSVNQKSDRFIVEAETNRFVDVDGNGFVSILEAEEVRAVIANRRESLEEMRSLMTLRVGGSNRSLERALDELVGNTTNVVRSRLENLVMDYEKFKSLSGFVRATLGIEPDKLSERVDNLESLKEMQNFQSNTLIALGRIKGKHPMIADLSARIKIFNEHRFRPLITQAKKGGVDEGISNQYWEEYQAIKQMAGEIGWVLALPQNVFESFKTSLVLELRQAANSVKLGDGNLSRTIETNINEIDKGQMTVHKADLILKLGEVGDKGLLKIVIDDWNTVGLVCGQLRVNNQLLAENNLPGFMASWQESLNDVYHRYQNKDLVDPQARAEIEDEIKRLYIDLVA